MVENRHGLHIIGYQTIFFICLFKLTNLNFFIEFCDYNLQIRLNFAITIYKFD